MSDNAPTEAEIAHARALIAAGQAAPPAPAPTDSAAYTELMQKARDVARAAEAIRQAAAPLRAYFDNGQDTETPPGFLDDLSDAEVVAYARARAEAPKLARDGNPVASQADLEANAVTEAELAGDFGIGEPSPWTPPSSYNPDSDPHGVNRR